MLPYLKALISDWGETMQDVLLLVTVSVMMSLFFFGTVYGVREGTLISALFAGRMANGFLRRWGRLFPQHRPID